MQRKITSLCLFLIWFTIILKPVTAQTNEIDAKIPVSQARILLLKSLILPGWGEHSLQYQKRGYVLNSTELGLWIGHAVLIFYGRSVEKDMKAYAATHAGIDPKGKDEYYFTDIGNYMNLYDYNDQKLRYRQFANLYPETGDYFWAWDSEDSREKFDQKRIDSQKAFHAASFALGGLIINRIISMIDIIALTKDRLETPVSDVQALIVPQNGQLTFTLNIGFK
ncbi:MAG: hypothetical protein ISS29_03530 [Candidatus Marinimicrobia bacterium]|nr:hypothetical protein [Candidatus Neomarinimicrobiota bacterium]